MVKVTTDYSQFYFFSTLALLHEIKNIEERQRETDQSDNRSPVSSTRKHDAYSAGAIIMSKTFLDAYANAKYDDIINMRLSWITEPEVTFHVPEWVQNTIRGLDTVDFRFHHKPPHIKYDFLLILLGRDKFQESETYKNIHSINKLRNKIIHNKPQSHEAGVEPTIEFDHIPDELERNPLRPTDSKLYDYMSYDIANWCLEQALELIKEFYWKLDREKLPDEIDILIEHHEDTLDD